MSKPVLVGLSGSFNSPSKTRALVEEAVDRAAERFNVPAETYDLNDFGIDLGYARSFADLGEVSRTIIDRIVQARALVIATPVYKGSYPGLFKHLIDLIDPSWLAGKPVLLAATGGGEKHALIIEHQLRPLFAFFEAQTLATGVYVSERDFANGRLASVPVLDRLDRAVGQFAPYLGQPRQQERHLSAISHLRRHQEAAAASF